MWLHTVAGQYLVINIWLYLCFAFLFCTKCNFLYWFASLDLPALVTTMFLELSRLGRDLFIHMYLSNYGNWLSGILNWFSSSFSLFYQVCCRAGECHIFISFRAERIFYVTDSTILYHYSIHLVLIVSRTRVPCFCISRVFSNVRSVLSQCNTRLRLLHLLYDIEIMWRKAIKHAFSMFYSLIKHGFSTNQSAQGPLYIIIFNKTIIPLALVGYP